VVTRQARNGVVIAVVAVVVTIFTTFYGIYDNHQLTRGTEHHLDTLTETLKPLDGLQRQGVDKLEALQEAAANLAKAAVVMSKAQDSAGTSRHDEIEALRGLTRQIEDLMQTPLKSAPSPKRR